eukprot:scaffold271404_cov16-Tisochrysis_lutea.AAC.2
MEKVQEIKRKRLEGSLRNWEGVASSGVPCSGVIWHMCMKVKKQIVELGRCGKFQGPLYWGDLAYVHESKNKNKLTYKDSQGSGLAWWSSCERKNKARDSTDPPLPC